MHIKLYIACKLLKYAVIRVLREGLNYLWILNGQLWVPIPRKLHKRNLRDLKDLNQGCQKAYFGSHQEYYGTNRAKHVTMCCLSCVYIHKVLYKIKYLASFHIDVIWHNTNTN